jgi:pseudouridine-5'-phosphate glycosidase
VTRITISPRVKQALAEGTPVVALESALITHGLPEPFNLQVARQLESVVETEGSIPATISLLQGVVRVGHSAEDLEMLATHKDVCKVSLRDLPAVLAQGLSGGTTVAATIHLANSVGIGVFATGGIGGVHRGHPEDISADLQALGATPIVVVCAGAKAILDLPRTLETLETMGVPVIGYGTDEFPAFTSHSSGLPVSARADSPQDVARMVLARDALGLQAALLVCVPIPREAEFPREEAESEIEAAVTEADAMGVSGKDLTPFLLSRLAEQTSGRSREANQALLVENARVASRIALTLTDMRRK